MAPRPTRLPWLSLLLRDSRKRPHTPSPSHLTPAPSGWHGVPPQFLHCHLPALSFPRLAPGGQQGPGRGLFGSCRPCGAGHGGICGQWSLGASSTPSSGYHHHPPPHTQPCEVAILWMWRLRLREGKGQAQDHSGARAGACWHLPACPLTDAHNTDVSPHNLAALQHDLLQLWGGGR